MPTETAPGEEVDRVVYASIARSGAVPYSRLEAIREASLRRNLPDGIHSVLIGLGGWYVQWLEGPGPLVREALHRIAGDANHLALQIVHSSRGPLLLPSRWNMMLLPPDIRASDVAQRVRTLRAQLLQGRQYMPASVLRRIATPFQWPGGVESGEPESFHRVGVCAAGSTPAFHLVRWVAQRHGTAASHRRLAGEEGRDAGMDTLDFLHEGQPCRLNALPWQSLLQGLLRVYLPDWQLLAVILSGSPRSDDLLMEKIAQVLGDLPGGARLVATAPDAQTHDRAMQVAQVAGIACEPIAQCNQDDLPALWSALSRRLAELGPPVDSSLAVPEGVRTDP